MATENTGSFRLTKAEEPIEQRRLPDLRNIIFDDWEQKLGSIGAPEKTDTPKKRSNRGSTAIYTWLKLIRIAEEKENQDYGKINDPIEKLAKRVHMSKTTFYDQVIAPLWSYHLIDLIEHPESKSKNKNAQKPINLIIYTAPKNDSALLSRPLEKERDYYKDWNSEAKNHALKKKNYSARIVDIETVQKMNGTSGETLLDIDPKTEKNPTVQKMNGLEMDRSKNGQSIYKDPSVLSFELKDLELKTINHEEDYIYKQQQIEKIAREVKRTDQPIPDTLLFRTLKKLSKEGSLENATALQIQQGILKYTIAAANDPSGVPENRLATFIRTEIDKEAEMDQAIKELEQGWGQAAATTEPERTKVPFYNWLEIRD